MTLPLPTVVDLKAQLNYTDPTAPSADDDELGFYLTAAVDLVEGMVGPLAVRTVTETHYRISSDVLVLRQAPATALTAISGRLYPGSTATSYLLADYVLDGEHGVVRLANGFRLYGDFTVTYTAGRDGIPYAVSLATLIIAGQLWETQRGTAPTPLQPDLTPTVPMGFAIPNRAATLLEPYIQVKVA